MKAHAEAGDIARQIVGARLRQLRLQCNLTAAEAGKAIRASESKISRMETGQRGFRRDDLRDLFTLYGITDPYQQEMLLSVAFGERKPDWWDSKELPLDAAVVMRLEQTADLIRTYQPFVVPPLLQTPEYAAAAYRMSRYPTPPPHVERSVEQLLRRQKVLSGADRPVLWAVIEEPVLWRPIAGVDAHIRQLIALTASAQMKGVSIQVNPMGSRFMPGYGPFTIFRSGHSRPQMVAVHGERDEVTERTVREEHAITFDRLSIAACERGDTTALLMRICDRIHVMDDRPPSENPPRKAPGDPSQ
ncbi:helix-turn-helix domain-containing protein [Streptosporangium sp. NBC_01495]|uniref:helix-turn-helix domain-containing protein n=1 Tax=Streptosporangium sp. NBC_01495 TaxID=2903899 RepID=UPI002E2FF1D0|nr:helix-turn-helix transcriptional regulator [Streptosporangium sp. NBC_01495]